MIIFVGLMFLAESCRSQVTFPDQTTATCKCNKFEGCEIFLSFLNTATITTVASTVTTTKRKSFISYSSYSRTVSNPLSIVVSFL